MAEIPDYAPQPEAEGLDFQRFSTIFRRRHLVFFLCLLVAWLLVWGAGWVIPAKYTSTTTILLERPNMPKDYVAPNIGEDLEMRMQSLTQQILNRTRLLGIIEKFHLYGGGGPGMADAQVEMMRKDIKVDLVEGENKRDVFGFTLSYTAKSPQLAQQVAVELTDLFIDENVKSQQQASQDTTNFLESQLESASSGLAEQDVKLRDYEAKHIGELPSQQQSNLQILSGLQAQLQSEQDALNNTRQQEVYDKEMISQLKSADNPAEAAADAGAQSVTDLDVQLEQMKARLADLSAHYTDRYPDVQNLKRAITKTEKERDDLVNIAKTKPASGTPVHRAGNRDQNAMLMQAQSQLAALESEVANRQKAVDALRAKVGEYQARLNAEPVREQELTELTRGYEQTKANYDSLLKKKEESAMATSMEQMQEGERFRTIDPPGLPTSPSFPNRLKLCGIGVGAGLALGLLVVIVLEAREGRLYSEKELKSQLPMAILVEIPLIEIPADALAKKRRTILGWAVAVTTTIIIAAGSAFTFLHS
jgi:polysaccharide chain length determinant protein (PEP-CTERM system associated)